MILNHVDLWEGKRACFLPLKTYHGIGRCLAGWRLDESQFFPPLDKSDLTVCTPFKFKYAVILFKLSILILFCFLICPISLVCVSQCWLVNKWCLSVNFRNLMLLFIAQKTICKTYLSSPWCNPFELFCPFVFIYYWVFFFFCSDPVYFKCVQYFTERPWSPGHRALRRVLVEHHCPLALKSQQPLVEFWVWILNAQMMFHLLHIHIKENGHIWIPLCQKLSVVTWVLMHLTRVTACDYAAVLSSKLPGAPCEATDRPTARSSGSGHISTCSLLQPRHRGCAATVECVDV